MEFAATHQRRRLREDFTRWTSGRSSLHEPPSKTTNLTALRFVHVHACARMVRFSPVDCKCWTAARARVSCDVMGIGINWIKLKTRPVLALGFAFGLRFVARGYAKEHSRYVRPRDGTVSCRFGEACGLPFRPGGNLLT